MENLPSELKIKILTYTDPFTINSKRFFNPYTFNDISLLLEQYR